MFVPYFFAFSDVAQEAAQNFPDLIQADKADNQADSSIVRG